MYIIIRIIYLTRGIRVERKGTFPLQGRAPGKVAADWIQEIKKEMDVGEVIKVEVDGVDITDKGNYS
ncbi:hypothetical protein [Mesobacillus stamsii]|uniref:Uncharacterized protein n=1 Tax=Mesobacillus stamsii TaxID=225347 RepID=A0ABU0FTT7_9BACI|nr:hypothetical protein [Mesobacillus stamsii]MDQ0412749.1 hypothetical protein [Mesobacillus stamsii]